jgi:hypothetical protein
MEAFDVPEVFVWIEGKAGGDAGGAAAAKNYFKISLKNILEE